MRVLTVQQPAAGAILALGKNIENRTWGTRYTGPLAIHAAARTMPPEHPFWDFEPYRDALAAATAAQRDALEPRGVILAIADLVDVHEVDVLGCCQPWGEGGLYRIHWALENIRPLATPLAFRGALGLRTLTPAQEAAVLAQVRS